MPVAISTIVLNIGIFRISANDFDLFFLTDVRPVRKRVKGKDPRFCCS